MLFRSIKLEKCVFMICYRSHSTNYNLLIAFIVKIRSRNNRASELQRCKVGHYFCVCHQRSDIIEKNSLHLKELRPATTKVLGIVSQQLYPLFVTSDTYQSTYALSNTSNKPESNTVSVIS